MKVRAGMGGEEGSPGRASLMQVLMCAVANTALLSSGMTLGFTGVVLPHMRKPNDILFLTESQASWIASSASLVIPVGCLLSGPLMDRLGRRAALLISCIPAVVGWTLAAFLPTLPSLLAARVLTGLGTGLSSTPATVFIAEAATPALRGFLVTGTSIAISLGVSLVYIMGLFLKENWRIVAGLCGMFPAASVFLIWLWMPESPAWLAGRGRTAAAGKALAVVRASSPDTAVVRAELAEAVRRASAGPQISASKAFRVLAKPYAYKPFIIMNLYFLFQQLTGIFVVIFYAVDVVVEAGVKTDPYVVTVLIGLTRLVFTVLGGLMSRKWGRRPPSLLSGVGMSVSLLVLAAHLYFKQDVDAEGPVVLELAVAPPQSLNLTDSMLETNLTQVAVESGGGSVVPVLAILVYILTSTVGFLTLPWSMLGEVFPTEFRGFGSGLTTCITYLVSSVTVKLYPTMMLHMGQAGVFGFYGLMAVLGTLFVALFLPETQGKTLADIEAYFAGKGSKKAGAEDEEAMTNSAKMITIKPAGTK